MMQRTFFWCDIISNHSLLLQKRARSPKQILSAVNGSMGNACPTAVTAALAFGRRPATNRQRKPSAKSHATGRKTLEVRSFIMCKYMSGYESKKKIYINRPLSRVCSCFLADCKYKFGRWAECDTTTGTRSRSGTLKKALFNAECQTTIKVSKPCTPKTPKPKGGEKKKGKGKEN